MSADRNATAAQPVSGAARSQIAAMEKGIAAGKSPCDRDGPPVPTEAHRLLFEQSVDGIIIIANGRIVLANPAFCTFHGLPMEQVLGMNPVELLCPEDRERGTHRITALLSDQPPVTAAVYRVSCADGSERWAEVHSRRLDWNGEPGLQCIVRDITEHKQIEDALRAAEREKETILDSLSELVVYHDRDMRILWVNRAACESVGKTRAQLIGEHCYEFWGARGDPCPDCPVAEAMRLGKPHALEKVTPDGRAWSVRGDPVRDESGDVVGSVEVALDVTGRRRAEMERDRLFNLSIDILGTAGFDGFIRQTNPAWSKTLGWSEQDLLRRPWMELVHPEDRAAARTANERLAAGQMLFSVELRFRRRDGSYRRISWNALPVVEEELFIAVGRDITEKADLEAQLRHSQKMEAVGQLAGGMAHDFNNILTAIVGNVELVRGELDGACQPGGLLHEGIQQIERSALRAAGLTRQLLAFSRHQVTRPESVDLNETLADMEKMLRRLIAENIELRVIVAPGLSCTCADPGQIGQVIMNLVVNARDAMPEGGKLTLETANVVVDEAYAATQADAHPGPHVVLAVSDTGCGMDAGTQERIFEPFFTTKPTGQGTGLGLATVYGIVRQSGGHITVHSEPGQGTTFKILLPAGEASGEQHHTQTCESVMPTGTETVLVCEDDRAVRELTVRVLHEAGYQVISAENGEVALQLAAECDRRIDLLVTDVIMPGMDGKRLADALAAATPGLRILFVSGYTANVLARHGVLNERTDFLEKPFARGSLLRRVRAVLDRAPAAATTAST